MTNQPTPQVSTDATCHACKSHLLVFDLGRAGGFGHRYAAVCPGDGVGLEFVVTGARGSPGHEHARDRLLGGVFTDAAVSVASGRALRGDLAGLTGSVKSTGGAA